MNDSKEPAFQQLQCQRDSLQFCNFSKNIYNISQNFTSLHPV